MLVQILLGRGNNGDVNQDGTFKISIYATDEPFGTGISNALRDAVKKLHPEPEPRIEQIYLLPTADPRNYDFGRDLQKLTDKRNENTEVDDGAPDVVFNTVFLNYSIALLKAYKERGDSVPLMAGDTFRRRTALDVLGDAANGQEGTSPLVADTTPSGEIFKRELMAATNLSPSSYDPQAYDAVAVVLLGAVIAAQALADPTQVTPERIRDALALVNATNGELVRPGTGRAGPRGRIDLRRQADQLPGRLGDLRLRPEPDRGRQDRALEGREPAVHRLRAVRLRQRLRLPAGQVTAAAQKATTRIARARKTCIAHTGAVVGPLEAMEARWTRCKTRRFCS